MEREIQASGVTMLSCLKEIHFDRADKQMPIVGDIDHR